MEPKLRVKFFATERGKEPVKEWLKQLNKTERKIIGEDLKTIQFGWPLGMPLVRSLENKIWELRSTIPKGIARVLFIAKNEQIILLHAFIKKTQKTPKNELEIAKKRSKQAGD
ncbi:MAG: hypothetical protein K940chlam2_00887 [Chlamydiae bacterium]|nr:hypothetical protein [Chlamydiota bacterium]